jgi:hypothetical protein
VNGVLLLARVVLVLHVVFVAFAVLGLVFIVTGLLMHWSWVRNPAFRLTHLLAIGFVVMRSWCGASCFMTTAEIRLRERAGDPAPADDFDRIGQALVMRGADPKGFRTAATAWGALTIATFSLRRDRRRGLH